MIINSKKRLTEIDALLQRAEDLAVAEVQDLAVAAILSKRTTANGFIMAMGTYFWLDKDNEIIEDKAWMRKMETIFDRYDDTMKLSGMGIRWDLDKESGEVIRRNDW